MAVWTIWAWLFLAGHASAVVALLAQRVRDSIGQPGSREERISVIAFLLIYTIIHYALAVFVHFFVSEPGGWGGGATVQLLLFLITVFVSMTWKIVYWAIHFFFPPSNDVRRESQVSVAVFLGGVIITVVLGLVTGAFFLKRSIFTGIILLILMVIKALAYGRYFYKNWNTMLPPSAMGGIGQKRSIASLSDVRSGGLYMRTMK